VTNLERAADGCRVIMGDHPYKSLAELMYHPKPEARRLNFAIYPNLLSMLSVHIQAVH
jgi:hypothetical protein